MCLSCHFWIWSRSFRIDLGIRIFELSMRLNIGRCCGFLDWFGAKTATFPFLEGGQFTRRTAWKGFWDSEFLDLWIWLANFEKFAAFTPDLALNSKFPFLKSAVYSERRNPLTSIFIIFLHSVSPEDGDRAKRRVMTHASSRLWFILWVYLFARAHLFAQCPPIVQTKAAATAVLLFGIVAYVSLAYRAVWGWRVLGLDLGVIDWMIGAWEGSLGYQCCKNFE